jgi:hypothetical protein
MRLLHTSRSLLYTLSMSSSVSVHDEIAHQTALLNKLRLNHADPSAVDEVKKKLGELKKSLALSSAAVATSKDAAKKRERMLLKTAKVSTIIVHLYSNKLTGTLSYRVHGTMVQQKCSVDYISRKSSRSASRHTVGAASIPPCSSVRTSSRASMARTRSSSSISWIKGGNNLRYGMIILYP